MNNKKETTTKQMKEHLEQVLNPIPIQAVAYSCRNCEDRTIFLYKGENNRDRLYRCIECDDIRELQDLMEYDFCIRNQGSVEGW